MKENYTKSEFSETWLKDGIIIQVINPDIHEISLAAAIQLIKDRKTASGLQIERPVLVVVNNAVNTSKEAKKYYEEDEPYLNIKAIAMVMDNYVSKVIASLVFKMKKNPVPIEFFNNKEKAVRWLEKYIF